LVFDFRFRLLVLSYFRFRFFICIQNQDADPNQDRNGRRVEDRNENDVATGPGGFVREVERDWAVEEERKKGSRRRLFMR
jgi:hypothetical protein